MSDRSCAEILSLLLKHGSWFMSAIELDNYVHTPEGRVCDGEELRPEAVRAVMREAPGLPTSPDEPEDAEPYVADADVARKAADYVASDAPSVTCSRCGQRMVTKTWTRESFVSDAVVRMTAECEPHVCAPAPERE